MKTKRIMFICHGNICRSPMAEYIFKKMVGEKGLSDAFVIDSTAVSYEEIGNDVYPPARKELSRHGVPCPPRAARHISAEDIRTYDLLLCMDKSNLDRLFRFSSEAPQKTHLLGEYGLGGKSIADPWYTGDFETTYREIVLSCERLLETLSEE